MKFIAAAQLIAIANAATCADFPKDSFDHAGCHMTVTFNQFNCVDLSYLMTREIKNWENGDSCI